MGKQFLPGACPGRDPAWYTTVDPSMGMEFQLAGCMGTMGTPNQSLVSCVALIKILLYESPALAALAVFAWLGVMQARMAEGSSKSASAHECVHVLSPSFA